MAKQTFLIFLLIATVAACTKAELASAPTSAATLAAITITTQEPSVTPTPLPTNTATATNTPAPTNTATTTSTPTIKPTATPVTPIWVEAGTPVPSFAVISPENAAQVVELARWGRGVIKDIDLSADGRWLAVAAGSGVYIHDVQDLSAEPRAIEVDGNVTAVSISPTGDKVALIMQGEELQTWQISPLKQLFKAESNVWNSVFSPDGEILALTTENGVELLQASTGESIHVYSSMLGVAFSLDTSELVVWDYGTVKKYDSRNEVVLFETKPKSHLDSVFEGTGVIITDVYFGYGNEIFVLAPQVYPNGFTGPVELQKGNDGTLIFAIENPSRLSEATKYVCNEPIFYWDPPEPAVPRQIKITFDRQIAALLYKDVAFSGDYNEYSSLGFYEISTGKQLYSVKEGIIDFVKEGIIDFAFMPDGKSWVAGFQNGRIEVRRTSDSLLLDSIDGYESPVLNLTASPDNQWVGIVYLDEVKIFRSEDGVLHYRYPASSIAFEPDNKRFALAYQDGTIELRNVADGNLISAVRAHEDKVTTIRFLPSGELLSAGFDCNLTRWHVPDMSRLGSLENVMVEGYITGNQVPMRVREFLVMPDGQTVTGLFLGGEFGVWSVEKGHLLRSPAWKDRTTILAASPDGRYLAVPAHEMPDSWNNEFTFLGSDGDAAGFSPDSRILAEGLSGEGTMHLWGIPSMTLLQTVTPRTDPVTAVTFTPDGHLILTGALDGVVRFWGVP